ncbi:MAG: helix-turn-helix transcriptional regulator [Alphaproteobacteria bacterium]|nr:helix-turn-helix transcriptional regulator [Alphaproteobacteria bacterium]
MSAKLHGLLGELPRAWLARHAPHRLGAPPDAPTLPRAVQRRHLDAVAEEGGEPAVLLLARGAFAHASEPLVYALLNAASVGALIDKEQRLNRYFHSHHRVRVEELGPEVLELDHVTLDGAHPARVESLFVLGLHLELLAEIGCAGVRATLPASSDPAAVVFRDGAVRPPIPAGAAHRWRMTWTGFRPRRAWTPGLDAVLAKASVAVDLEGGPRAVDLVRALVGVDLTHRWSLPEVARRLGRSTRSLQRALGTEGTSFLRVLEDARLAQADTLLADPAVPITEIAWRCGFSDTSHFSRRFKVRRGAPPSAVRGG